MELEHICHCCSSCSSVPSSELSEFRRRPNSSLFSCLPQLVMCSFDVLKFQYVCYKSVTNLLFVYVQQETCGRITRRKACELAREKSATETEVTSLQTSPRHFSSSWASSSHLSQVRQSTSRLVYYTVTLQSCICPCFDNVAFEFCEVQGVMQAQVDLMSSPTSGGLR